MQPPTGLHVVGRLAPVNAVIAEEIFCQFRHGNALMYGADKGVRSDFC